MGPVFAEAANLNSQLRSKSAGAPTMGSPRPASREARVVLVGRRP